MARRPSSSQQRSEDTRFQELRNRLNTADKLAAELNIRYTEQQGAERPDRSIPGRFDAVQNLINIGEVIAAGIANEIIKTGTGRGAAAQRARGTPLAAWLTQNGVKYTYSYMTRAYRFFDQQDTIGPAISWYQDIDNNRTRHPSYTFMWRVTQPTGVVYVTEVLRAFGYYQTVVQPMISEVITESPEAIDLPAIRAAQLAGLRAVDRQMIRDRVVRPTLLDEDNQNRSVSITPSLLAGRERALLLAAVSACVEGNIQPFVGKWDNPKELIEWLDDAENFVMKHLRAARLLGLDDFGNTWDNLFPANAEPWNGYKETPQERQARREADAARRSEARGFPLEGEDANLPQLVVQRAFETEAEAAALLAERGGGERRIITVTFRSPSPDLVHVMFCVAANPVPADRSLSYSSIIVVRTPRDQQENGDSEGEAQLPEQVPQLAANHPPLGFRSEEEAVNAARSTFRIRGSLERRVVQIRWRSASNPNFIHVRYFVLRSALPADVPLVIDAPEQSTWRRLPQ